MPIRPYDGQMTLREARAAYFEANGFGRDGGYSKAWEVIRLGPVPIPIRNIPARVAALRLHDLHHLVTGYTTDLVGEAEIGAWEIAAGCGDKWFAWIINAQALLLGLFIGPRATYAAFVRGRHSHSLYAESFSNALLDQTAHRVPGRFPEPGLGTARLGVGLSHLSARSPSHPWERRRSRTAPLDIGSPRRQSRMISRSGTTTLR